MRVACEFLVRECARGVVTRDFCPPCRLPSARNNEPVIGILGRVCISIQDVVVPSMSPFRLFDHSNFSFVNFHAHDLYFPRLRPVFSPFTFPFGFLSTQSRGRYGIIEHGFIVMKCTLKFVELFRTEMKN